MIDVYCAFCGKKDWECICDPQGGALIDAIKNQAEQMRKLTDSIDQGIVTGKHGCADAA